ncbi:TlpA family protein disulfide reductase, partial [Xenophilus sp.]
PASASRRSWLRAGVAVAAAAAGAGMWWRRRAEGGAGGGTLDASFWALRFDRPEGGELRMDALRGQPLLVNFWATWCPPCVEELPMLDRFFRDQAANGWQVIGLAIDQPSAVRKFLARLPLAFPVGLAGLQGTELVKSMGNPGGGLPFSLLIGKDGQVAKRKIGQLEPADLEAWRRAVHG